MGIVIIPVIEWLTPFVFVDSLFGFMPPLRGTFSTEILEFTYSSFRMTSFLISTVLVSLSKHDRKFVKRKSRG